MILAGDVGGTKVHLGVFDTTQSRTLICEQKYQSRSFATFSLLLADFLKQHPDFHLMQACLGIAGPIRNGRCQATNLPWVIDAKEIEKETKIPTVCLINDLEANAWGLRCLQPKELCTLNEGVATEGNAALIAAGTGLGEAGLYWNGKSHSPFACEGGHADFAPRNEEEIELWRYVHAQFSHVSYERLLSGAGLYLIYRFLVETGREKENLLVEKDPEPQRVIGVLAVKQACSTSLHAVQLFCSIYGAEAGNLALKMLSVNGIYIGGGIAPKLLPVLQSGVFLQSFMAKGRFDDLLSQMPIHVVRNENTALLGAYRYAVETT